MNIRKPVDYSAMFAALDTLMSTEMPQMKLYYAIGRLVSDKPERGAAVAAAEYLCDAYPDVSGFSPRNLRRMRDLYRSYGADPKMLAEAMTVGWTQNVVILEADLTLQEKEWYIGVVKRFGWSELTLLEKIRSDAHKEVSLDFQNEVCYTGEKTPKRSVPTMTRILFVCHGNICRSPMAEFVMKDLVKKAGLENQFHIESAATSTEEIGNPVYPPARCKLAEHGIDCAGKMARQLKNRDYDQFDLLIGMDRANIRNMYRICGGDYDEKMHLLMEFTDRPDAEVADPWYTDDFEAAWQDILSGCRGEPFPQKRTRNAEKKWNESVPFRCAV